MGNYVQKRLYNCFQLDDKQLPSFFPKDICDSIRNMKKRLEYHYDDGRTLLISRFKGKYLFVETD